ncbi:MAG: glycosyltransferase [Ruminococcus sp.]|nr:glycosyltransferase [Ruminococcus sp.]
MSKYDFSVVIPAHNEEDYIGKCLKSVRKAAKAVSPQRVQIIVVANRCTDRTAAIAKNYGAEVLANDEKCIASIRNTGVKAALGNIVVTIDADSTMSKNSLREIRAMLSCGKYIGGGTNPRFDRMSLGIALSSVYILICILPEIIRARAFLSGAMFWFYKRDFMAVGGFDEKLVSLEDIDFAKRLKKYGESRNKKYGTLRKSYIITSSRKFDQFGDWYLLKNRKLVKQIFSGKNRKAADSFYYDAR